MATKDYKTNLLLLSCSGASNTGCYADRAARELDMSLQAEMVCFAKLAIKNEALINKLKTTYKKIVVLDGCALNCAQKTMDNLGIPYFKHLNMTDFDIVKGEMPLTDDRLKLVEDAIMEFAESNVEEEK